MLMSFFVHKPAVSQSNANANRLPVHPGMGGSGPRGGGHGRPHDHPAMRMAAAQAEAQSGGGGKGAFTWMVPIYMIGFIPKKKRSRRSRYDYEASSEEEDKKFRGKMGKKKLQTLQECLRQTEEAMRKWNNWKTSNRHKFVAGAEEGQYIGDLEKALKQFNDISEAYEKEKDRYLEEHSASEEDKSEEEDRDKLEEDGSLEELDNEEAEELLRQKKRELEALRKAEEERKRKQKKNQKYVEGPNASDPTTYVPVQDCLIVCFHNHHLGLK